MNSSDEEYLQAMLDLQELAESRQSNFRALMKQAVSEYLERHAADSREADE
jgi:hypothetical protein